MAELKASEYFLWLDLETTGLIGKNDLGLHGEQEHDILEIAIVITDKNMKEFHSSQYLVKNSIEQIKNKCNDYCIDMHTKSGLFDDISSHGYSTRFLYDIETDIIKIIEQYCGDVQPMLAGSTIHFDRGFINAQMPRLGAKLFYRNFDVSMIAIYNDLLGKSTPFPIKGSTKHRAMDDVRNSMGLYENIKKQNESKLSKVMNGIKKIFLLR